MSVFDKLPVREDGTKVTPFDDDWKNNVLVVYEPQWSRQSIAVARVWDFPPAIKTGEFVDPAFVAMFSKQLNVPEVYLRDHDGDS